MKAQSIIRTISGVLLRRSTGMVLLAVVAVIYFTWIISLIINSSSSSSFDLSYSPILKGIRPTRWPLIWAEEVVSCENIRELEWYNNRTPEESFCGTYVFTTPEIGAIMGIILGLIIGVIISLLSQVVNYRKTSWWPFEEIDS